MKHDIANDIIKDKDFDVSPEMIHDAIEWYTSHVGYHHVISIAGTKRIDLDGRPVGTVTKQEALAAHQCIKEIGEKQKRPIKTFSDMYADHQISDDAVKKLDAPPLPSESKPTVPTVTAVTAATATTAPEFVKLYEILADANAVVVGISDLDTRAAVAKTLLDVVIQPSIQPFCAGKRNPKLDVTRGGRFIVLGHMADYAQGPCRHSPARRSTGRRVRPCELRRLGLAQLALDVFEIADVKSGLFAAVERRQILTVGGVGAASCAVES